LCGVVVEGMNSASKQVMTVSETVNDDDTCSSHSTASQASESLLSNCHGVLSSNGIGAIGSTLSSSNATAMTREKPPANHAVTATSAADGAGVAMVTDVARCEDDAAMSDCHLSQSVNGNNNVINNNNNNKTQQSSSSSSLCCVLDATRLSATTFHGDAAVSRLNDTAHFTPGQ